MGQLTLIAVLSYGIDAAASKIKIRSEVAETGGGREKCSAF